MTSRKARALPLCAVLVALAVSNAASGQQSLTLAAGGAEYDLSGTGWTGTAGAYFERAVAAWFRVEVGSGVFWYRPQFRGRVIMLLPEAGIAFQGPGVVPLYLGIGVGHSLTIRGGQLDDLTVYGALGLSLPVFEGWQVRPELRLRVVDPWVGTIGGITLGVTKQLRP